MNVPRSDGVLIILRMADEYEARSDPNRGSPMMVLFSLNRDARRVLKYLDQWDSAPERRRWSEAEVLAR